MNDYKFYAFLNRLKYIGRWSLMRNLRQENVAEHSYQTALLAHALCLIENTVFGGNVNADEAAAVALYHETAEVVTGDMPTPVKYRNEDIRRAYKAIEAQAEQRILDTLPPKLKEALTAYVRPDKTGEAYRFVKFADKLAALIKCIEETRGGNDEFRVAQAGIEAELKAKRHRAVDYFLTHFVQAYYCSLDEMKLE